MTRDKKRTRRVERQTVDSRTKDNALEDSSSEKQEVVESDIMTILGESLETPVVKAKGNFKLYFNSGTQDAIVKFQTEKNKKTRDGLYVQEIMPAFEKLVENLINIHRFSSLHDSYDDLKRDCVNFLFETMHKFDASRGTNAFSYFNVVAKNWLIIKTKQKLQRSKRNVSLDDPSSLTAHETLMLEEYDMMPSQDELIDSAMSVTSTVNMLYEIRSKTKTENELTCINSIITIFENIDEIDLLNKSAVLLYMRELSGLTPKQLTTAMQSIKRHYKKSKIDSRDD